MRSIVLDRVCVSLGAATPLVDVDITLAGGRCTAVVGPSGTGKTTLLRLLNRLGEPDSGRILFDDKPIDEFDVLELRRRIDLVPQGQVLLTELVSDEIRVGRADLTTDQVGVLLGRVGLPPDFAHRRCADLSGGEAQRVCLARGLAVEPDVLLLDEPTSALDAVSAAAIGKVIAGHTAAGGTVVLVSHDSGFVGTVADEILLLDGGKLNRIDEQKV